ncbi:MAG TPA: murein L,D-transpeptidase catalytic domain family protein [Puia sp.]|nr:murein L,D-transpeptidase catalytic domain family protein [Puia sp.]
MKMCNPYPTTTAKLFLALALYLASSFRLHASTVYDGVTAIRTTMHYKLSAAAAEARAKRAEMRMIIATAASIYEEMDLEDSGLSRKAFEAAWTGYYKLKKKGLLRRTNILSICDFSQSSSNQRMYVIDVRNRRMLYRTFVAHGINSGEEYANSFSNKMESCKSSLGFYITTGTYSGVNGLSLRINGVDKGFNDNALRRAIVIHGAGYVSQRILRKYGVMGTTFGCPAIPTEMTTQIIPVVKNGSCFFIYYPSKKYLAQSSVLNS